MATIEHERVSVSELRGRLDKLAQEKLGIGVDEFLARCRDQSLDMASPAVSRLAVLGRIILAAQTGKR